MAALSPDAKTSLRRQADQRLVGMRQDRYSYWTHWRELSQYMLPRRGKWLITPNVGYRGSPINQRIIDSTTTLALRTLTAGLTAGVTNPARKWFRLTLRDKDLAKFGPVKSWLADVGDRMLEIFAGSNFYNRMGELYEELALFGTGSMIIYEDPEDVIRCYIPTAGEYYLAQNYRLKVDTLYREFTMSVRQVAQQFGVENVSQTVKSLLERSTGGGSPDKEIIVGHGIEPNDAQIDGAFGPKGAAYREVYWEIGSSQSTLLRMRPFYDFPAIAPRWHTLSNDVYGRGPGMDALGDCKQLQVETKRKAEGIEKQVRPPMVADIQLKNQPAANLPGGITYIAGHENIGMKSVYDVELNLENMVKDIAEIQDRIKEVFYYPLFRMIAQLDTVRTATEIIARKEENLLQLGPVLERFDGEALGPAIERTFNIMVRRGLIPPPPREVSKQPLMVQYTSMLSEAQKAIGTTGIERLYAFAGSVAGVKPEILDRLDADETIEDYNDMLGNPPDLLVPIEVAMKMREAKAKQQQQQQAMQMMQAVTQGAKTLSDVDVGGGQGAVSAMLNGPQQQGAA